MPLSFQYPVLVSNLIGSLKHLIKSLAAPRIEHPRTMQDGLRWLGGNVIMLEEAAFIPYRSKDETTRVMCVVLSASSVPRVGKGAAVRRLHRADLVREMAGMLDDDGETSYWPESGEEEEEEEEEEDDESE